MPKIPVELEFITASPIHSVPAGTEDVFIFDAPEGYLIWSWGFGTLHESLQILGASIQMGPNEPVRPEQFIATVKNSDTVDHAFRWAFILLKV